MECQPWLMNTNEVLDIVVTLSSSQIVHASKSMGHTSVYIGTTGAPMYLAKCGTKTNASCNTNCTLS